MNKDEFQSQKFHAISAGVPINKFDIKLSNLAIDQAFSNAYGSQTDSLNQTQQSSEELQEILKSFRKLNGGSNIKLNPREVVQKSEIMRNNPYFHDFMTKHDESLEDVMNEINYQVGKVTGRNHQTLLQSNSQNTGKPQSYREKMQSFLSNQNLYRNLNSESLKDIKNKNEV